ncbi:BTAD domain-containing putative transcriptional regulator, partial [Streptomyces boncukensis]|nr:AfsR/SARP family transcriptional regulator [Streptomyces boncukensis]
MQISILGPLQVRTQDGPVAVSGARLRTLLTLLALHANQVVTNRRLIDGIWGGDPPSGALHALRALVSRLRRVLPEPVIVSRTTGYELSLPPEAVDIRRFERLAALGRGQLASDPGAAARTLREALDLWRGNPLSEIEDTELAHGARTALTDLRTGAVEDRVEAELRLGAGPRLTAELAGLVELHPMRERLRGQLMQALYSAGRQAEALEVFEEARRMLGSGLGVDPSPLLKATHMAILQGRPVADVTGEYGEGAPPPLPAPRTEASPST